MKTTVVPAQVTTVEDKVAGNLSVTQLMLLTAPVFLGGAIFAFMPPMTKLTTFKLVVVISLTLTCLMMAIRIKGKIIAQWIAIISKYNLRPRFYIFNKNDIASRSVMATRPKTKPTKKAVKTKAPLLIPSLATPELVRVNNLVTNPEANFHFKATKGGLRVYINEVE